MDYIEFESRDGVGGTKKKEQEQREDHNWITFDPRCAGLEADLELNNNNNTRSLTAITRLLAIAAFEETIVHYFS